MSDELEMVWYSLVSLVKRKSWLETVEDDVINIARWQITIAQLQRHHY